MNTGAFRRKAIVKKKTQRSFDLRSAVWRFLLVFQPRDLLWDRLRVYTRDMETRCICTALRQAASQSTALYDEALAPSGIKVTMFRLLRHINAGESVSITELAEIVSLDRSTLGRNLRVLEKQSLVSIGSGEDGRARMVSLTKTGRAVLQDAEPRWQTAQSRFVEIVDNDTMAVLDRLIHNSFAPDVTSGQRK